MPREDISPFGPQHDRPPEVIDDVSRPDVGFAGRRGALWTGIGRWLVPIMMCIAYVFMALTAETTHTNQAWMAVGLAFVLVLWWMFRVLSSTAALSRAIAVGDVPRILLVSDRELVARRRGRAKFLVAKAFACEVRGTWDDAWVAINEAQAAIEREGAATQLPYLAAIRVAMLVETGKVAEARAALRPVESVRGFDLDGISRLAKGRVAWAEGDLDGAMALLQKVIDDIRAGSAQRATAHLYAARIAEARGKDGAKHRAEAKKLLGNGWVARTKIAVVGPASETKAELDALSTGWRVDRYKLERSFGSGATGAKVKVEGRDADLLTLANGDVAAWSRLIAVCDRVLLVLDSLTADNTRFLELVAKTGKPGVVIVANAHRHDGDADAAKAPLAGTPLASWPCFEVGTKLLRAMMDAMAVLAK